MFRIGGSTGTGITSGLDTPRQGYKEPGVIDKNDVIRQDAQRIFDVGVDLRKENQIPTNKMLSGSLPGFLTSFGLNLASATPRGNIFSSSQIYLLDSVFSFNPFTKQLFFVIISSTKVFHSLHCGHFPSHFGDCVPQLWQKNAD